MTTNIDSRLHDLEIHKDDILAALSLPAEPHTIFLSGSVIEGYSNTESDLDVYVVFTDDIQIERVDCQRDDYAITIDYVSNWRLDIEIWSVESIKKVANRLQNTQVDDWNESLTINIADLKLAHNLRVGYPIQHPSQFNELQTMFKFDHISRLLMNRNLVMYNNSAEDASGAISSEQHGAAIVTAREAAQFAIDAYLAAHGETNHKSKWRYFKLQKLGEDDLIKRYLQIEVGPGEVQPEELLVFCAETLIFANSIVLRAQKRFS